jgi:ketosteroid isomerase-like protein
MGETNPDRVRSAYDAWNRRDLEGALAHLDEQVEWRMSGEIVGTAASYHGHEGVRAWWLDFLEPFESVEIEPLELAEPFEDIVLVRVRLRARGRQQIEVDMVVSHLYELRKGMITRVSAFTDHAKASAAAAAAAG